jgi:septum formation protein
MIPFLMNKQILLASASPRRLELLRQIGLTPLVRPVEVGEEQRLNGRGPGQLVKVNAQLKALAALNANPASGRIIIGADTVVVLNGQVFGKPGDATEAAAMLRALSGQRHGIYTGICLIDTDGGKNA